MSTTAPARISLTQEIQTLESQFVAAAATPGEANFRREAGFALQALQANSYLEQIARSNLPSLRAAVVNVAAVSLSLNPVLAQAYLVPRKGQVCLDIGAQGFVELALRSGHVKAVHYGLVYERDTFVAPSPGKMATHTYDPFANRGEVRGGYAQIVLADGTPGPFFAMTAAEIEKRKQSSESWKRHHVGGRTGKSSSCTWCDWPEEMARKTILRAARRSWPQTPAMEKAVALEAAALDEGEALPRLPDDAEQRITQAAYEADLPQSLLCQALAVARLEDLDPSREAEALRHCRDYAAARAKAMEAVE